MSSGRVCVRPLFVLRSVASCVAFVLCWFVWRSCAAADCAADHRGKQSAAGRRNSHVTPQHGASPWGAGAENNFFFIYPLAAKGGM